MVKSLPTPVRDTPVRRMLPGPQPESSAKSMTTHNAETVRLAEEVVAAQKVYLFHEFNDAMARLYKKYGVIEVAEQCRAWADFIDATRARLDGGRDA